MKKLFRTVIFLTLFASACGYAEVEQTGDCLIPSKSEDDLGYRIKWEVTSDGGVRIASCGDETSAFKGRGFLQAVSYDDGLLTEASATGLTGYDGSHMRRYMKKNSDGTWSIHGVCCKTEESGCINEDAATDCTQSKG